MPASDSEPTTWVFTKRLGFGRVAQPNESRLSCGAKLEHSQMEFYHTARRTFAGLIEEGRRQLQAHVRLRTTIHGSGPSSTGSTEGHSPSLPSRRDLGCRMDRCSELTNATAPRTQRDFHWIAPLDGNEPPRRMPASTTEPTTWVFTKELVCGGMRSLTNRA